jgi:hypothetical protein
MTGVKRASYNLFQQPCAERIEFTNAGHVDRQYLGFLDARRNQIDQAFQSSDMNSCPGPAWAQYQRVISGCLTQQGKRIQSLSRSKALGTDWYPSVMHFTMERQQCWLFASKLDRVQSTLLSGTWYPVLRIIKSAQIPPGPDQVA